MAAILFSGLVTFLAIGLLWFYVVRPMLEDFGIIAVNDNADAAPVVMSRTANNDAPFAASSLETDAETDGQTDQPARIKAEELFPLYKAMRDAGIGREVAAAAFKASGLPFNNNVWAKAAPASSAAYVTPIVGRPTAARFETDPDYPYQAPAH